VKDAFLRRPASAIETEAALVLPYCEIVTMNFSKGRPTRLLTARRMRSLAWCGTIQATSSSRSFPARACLDLIGNATTAARKDHAAVHLQIKAVAVVPCGMRHRIECAPPVSLNRLKKPGVAEAHAVQPVPARSRRQHGRACAIAEEKCRLLVLRVGDAREELGRDHEDFFPVPPRINARPTSKAYSQPEQAALRSNASACGIPSSLASLLAMDGTADRGSAWP